MNNLASEEPSKETNKQENKQPREQATKWKHNQIAK